MFPEWSVNRERFVIENICRPDLYSGAQVSPLKPEPAPQVSRLFQFRGEVLLRPGPGAFSKRNMFLQQ